LGGSARPMRGRVLTLVFAMYLFFGYESRLWSGFVGNGAFHWLPPVRQALVAAVLPVAIAPGPAVAPRPRGGFLSISRRDSNDALVRLTIVIRTATLVVLVSAATLTILTSEPKAFQDRTTDPLFAAAAARRGGLLATAGTLHLVQLRSRRPVLLDGGG